MYDTHFANTHGNDDIYNYSTCHDMALLLAYAAGNPLFREIMSASEYAITPVGFFPDGAKYQSSVLRYCEGYNGRYQFRFEGLAGGKSGYTPDARYTLALVCSPGGEDIVYVTARSWKEQYYPAHIEDASVLAEYLK
jgi:D-alanyl-D-alanine carboxypeptidase